MITTVFERTPGITGRQQERWQFHCSTAAVFLGPVGATDLQRWPQAAAAIRTALPQEWPTNMVEEFMDSLDRHSQRTGYLFSCRVCHTYRGYVDVT